MVNFDTTKCLLFVIKRTNFARLFFCFVFVSSGKHKNVTFFNRCCFCYQFDNRVEIWKKNWKFEMMDKKQWKEQHKYSLNQQIWAKRKKNSFFFKFDYVKLLLLSLVVSEWRQRLGRWRLRKKKKKKTEEKIPRRPKFDDYREKMSTATTKVRKDRTSTDKRENIRSSCWNAASIVMVC